MLDTMSSVNVGTKEGGSVAVVDVVLVVIVVGSLNCGC